MNTPKQPIKPLLSRGVKLCAAILITATALTQILNIKPAFADTGGYYWPDATALDVSLYDWGYHPCPSSDSTCANYPSFNYNLNGTVYGMADPWIYNLRNCTSYVAWKINQKFGVSVQGWGDAASWAGSATGHYSVYPGSSHTPQVGEIAQWGTEVGGGHGHVAYVYAVDPTTHIASLDEYNAAGTGNFTGENTSPRTTASTSAGTPDNYIHIGNTYSDGTYVQTPDGKIYAMAGGAAFYVPNWNEVGGSHPVTAITQATFSAFPQYPLDGTYFQVYGNAAIYVSAGGAGFYVPNWNEVGGSHPYTVLPATGVSQKIRQYPLDDTYFQVYGNAAIYASGGGAGFYIPNWNEVGGYHPFTVLPATGVSLTIRQYPLDNTYFQVYGSSSIYVSAGGMGLYVTSWAAVGGAHPLAILPATGVSLAMRSYALDGTYVKGYQSGEEFEAMSGAVTRITTTPLPPATIVDDWAIINQLHGTE